VGFVGANGRGLGGLETALDSTLAGRDGRATYESAAGGRAIPLGASSRQAPVEGRDVQLTIDRDIQWLAEDALARKIRETGAESGYVVVLDSRTGAIHALASAPGFDPARAGKFPAAARGNRAVIDAYEPGSTGKVITAAALIERQVVTPSTPVTVPNRIIRGGKSFKDFRDHPTQRLTYAGTLAKSSNIGTILAAERLKGGLPELYPYFRAFGLGTPTGSGLPGEARAPFRRPRAGRPPPATRSRSVRGTRSTRCRWPRCSRPSPTTAYASRPMPWPGSATPTAGSPPLPHRARPGWSARARRRRCAR
jgi:cell division protein FtsI (penicillin-binding protein 3)